MDKINSGLFSSTNHKLGFLHFEFQPKLFVNVPKQTHIKGEYSIEIYEYLLIYLSKLYCKINNN